MSSRSICIYVVFNNPRSGSIQMDVRNIKNKKINLLAGVARQWANSGRAQSQTIKGRDVCRKWLVVWVGWCFSRRKRQTRTCCLEVFVVSPRTSRPSRRGPHASVALRLCAQLSQYLAGQYQSHAWLQRHRGWKRRRDPGLTAYRKPGATVSAGMLNPWRRSPCGCPYRSTGRPGCCCCGSRGCNAGCRR